MKGKFPLLGFFRFLFELRVIFPSENNHHIHLAERKDLIEGKTALVDAFLKVVLKFNLVIFLRSLKVLKI